MIDPHENNNVPRTAFIYVKIPVSADADPFHQREYSLDQALREMGLGSVVGWGDSLGPVQADGSRPAAFLRIDINATDLDGARAALREILLELGAGVGTEIHYTLERRNLQDIYTSTHWLLEQPLA